MTSALMALEEGSRTAELGYRLSASLSLLFATRGRTERQSEREALSMSMLLDQDWRALAVCAHNDPDLWFSPGAVEHKEAKRICRGCPVRKQCLAYAMEAPVDHGVWGGLTERERRRHRRLALEVAV